MIKIAVALSVFAVTAVAHAAEAYKVAAGSELHMVGHITGGSFAATNKQLSGTVETDDTHKATSGAIVAKASAFESGMSMRDGHMRDKYLEADKYPNITLDLTGATLPEKGVGEFDVDGAFTCHGQKKPVKLHIKVVEEKGELVATSTFQVDITDYGIAQPRFAVVKMDIKVDLTATIHFTRGK